MKYPNNINKKRNNNISYGNRGMVLERIIDVTNRYYLDKDIAVIYKKPTPVNISRVKYGEKKVKGYLTSKSSLDYVGVYKGKYIDFDAKSTKSKTSFPLSNVQTHQIDHIKKILDHGGISFLIIEMNNNYYLLHGNDLIDFVNNNTRKSIPFSYIEEKGKEINIKPNLVLDYLSVLNIN